MKSKFGFQATKAWRSIITLVILAGSIIFFQATHLHKRRQKVDQKGTTWLKRSPAAPQYVFVVPIRDRDAHKLRMVEALANVSEHFNWKFHIWFIEQSGTGFFNRAKLFNVGFLLAQRSYQPKLPNSTCVILHDVDMLPFTVDSVDYGHCDPPMHLASEAEQFGRDLPYVTYTGGVVSAQVSAWEKINGMSNNFLGWGGEDDELLLRFMANNLALGQNGSLVRPNPGHGRFRSLNDEFHTSRSNPMQQRNADRFEERKRDPSGMMNDGLSTCTFEVADSGCIDSHVTENLVAFTCLVHLERRPSQMIGVKLDGRLGNHLFIVASVNSIARYLNRPWCLIGEDTKLLEQAVTFRKEKPKICSDEVLASSTITVTESGYAHFDTNLFVIPDHAFVRIEKYLQSVKYFQSIDLPFQIHSHLIEAAVDFIQKNHVSIAVHVRRGDLLYQNVELEQEYFARGIEMVFEKDPAAASGRILVCTDDPGWVQAQAIFSNAIISTASPTEDLARLSVTKHVLTSIGTFGWWGMYFNDVRIWSTKDSAGPDGMRLYYPNPVRLDTETRYQQGFSISDFWPGQWTPVKHKCAITIVTAFYKSASPAFAVDLHLEWIKNFVSVRVCLVVYTDSPTLFVQNGDLTYKVVHERKLESELKRLHNDSTELWSRQVILGLAEGLLNGPDVYWLDALKPFYLDEVSQANYFSSLYFYWLDAHCIHSPLQSVTNWMSLMPPQHRHVNDSFITLMWANNRSDTNVGKDWINGYHQALHDNSLHNTLVGSSAFGGTRAAAERWVRAYKRTFYRLVAQGRFIGRPQELMIMQCVENPGLCALIPQAALTSAEPFTRSSMVPYLTGDLGNPEPTFMFPLVDSCLNPLRAQSRTAVLTALTHNFSSFGLGARKLLRSARNHSASSTADDYTVADFIVLELSSFRIPLQVRSKLESVGWQVCTVKHFAASDEFAKLHAWQMTPYERVVYIDSDCLVVNDVTPLFNVAAGDAKLWATRDTVDGRATDAFNLGVFVVQPSKTEFQHLREALHDSNYISLQLFLNQVYRDTWQDFGRENNVDVAAFPGDVSTWTMNLTSANVVHFGVEKPWSCSSRYQQICSVWDQSPS